MLDLFKGIFDSETTTVISVETFIICLLASLIIGMIFAFMSLYKSKSSKSFFATLAILPCVVSTVIMMVNGNIGAGVAVAGAFSLVRFRSAPGTAREIAAIFIAMGIGLIAGMGYIAYALLFAVILGVANIIFVTLTEKVSQKDRTKTINITIPEDLDYSEVFTDIFNEYAKDCELIRVKTTNMGSMFRLTYNITLKSSANEKDMIDKIRCRNGNLEISVSRQENVRNEL